VFGPAPRSRPPRRPDQRGRDRRREPDEGDDLVAAGIRQGVELVLPVPSSETASVTDAEIARGDLMPDRERVVVPRVADVGLAARWRGRPRCAEEEGRRLTPRASLRPAQRLPCVARAATRARTRAATRRSRSAFASSIVRKRRTPRGGEDPTSRAEKRQSCRSRPGRLASSALVHSARRASSRCRNR